MKSSCFIINESSEATQDSSCNPYKSDIASCLAKDSKDPIIQFFSRDKVIEEKEPNIPLSSAPANKSAIILQSEVLNGFPLPKTKKVNTLDLLGEYIKYDLEKPEFSKFELPNKPTQLLNFTLTETKFGFEFIEPITCTAFLFDGESIISEPWHFIPQQSFKYLGIEQNESMRSGFFKYSKVTSSVTVIILFHRIIQVDSGQDVNKYYEKQTPKNLENAKHSVIMSFPRISDVYSTFAITAAPLIEIMSSMKEFTFPEPIFCQTSDLSNTNEILENIRTKKQKIPISVVMTLSIKSVHSLNGIQVIPNIEQDVSNEPCTLFRHRVTFRLDLISLKKLPSDKKARNIFAVFSLQEGIHSPRIPLMVNNMTNKVTTHATSKCSYHQKQPVFDDYFVANLPAVLPQNLYFIVFIYHCLVNPDEKQDRTYIGYSAIPIIKNGKPVSNGPVECGISFEHDIVEQDANNFIQGEISYDSSVYPNEDNIFELFSKLRNNEVDLDLLHAVDPLILRKYLLQTMILIVNTIPKNNILGVSALIELTQCVLPVYSEVSRTLAAYAKRFFGPIPGVLEAWGEIASHIPADEHGIKRKDVEASEMLFELSDVEGAYEFSQKFGPTIVNLAGNGLLQAKRLAQNYAFFITKYDKAPECIQLMTTMFADIPNDSDILCHFLNAILSTQLFHRMVFETHQIQDLCRRAVNATQSRPMQRVFSIILKHAWGLQRCDQMDVADHLLDLLILFSPISEIPFSDEQDLHPSITLFLWLLCASSEDALSRFIEENKGSLNDIFKSLHFILRRLRDGVGTSQEAALRQLERKYTITKQMKKGGTVSRPRVARLNARKTTTYIRKSRELALCSELCALRFCVLNPPNENIQEISSVYYHVLSQDLAVNAIPEVVTSFIDFVDRNIEALRTLLQTPISKHMQKILEMTKIYKADFTKIASLPEVLQAIAQSNLSLVGEILPESLNETIIKIKKIEELLEKEENQDEKAQLLITLLDLYKESPDALFLVYSRLAELHQKNNNKYEEIECRRAMLKLVKNKEQASISLAKQCINEKLFELAKEILSNVKEETEKAQQVIDSIPEVAPGSRMFSHYFMVTFINNNNSTSYVYRERELTNLYGFIDKLQEQFPDLKILKGASDKMDDPEAHYAQITFIEPYVSKKANLTEFERNYNINRFFYEEPFTAGKSAQGSLSEQYIKKTIIETNMTFPGIIRRSTIKSIKEKIIEPISVSLHMIRERTEKLKEAAEKKNVQTIRQLLHGNLLAQVNVGPAAIAKEFFGSESPKVPKLKAAFKEFIEANKALVEIHKTFDDQQTSEMQQEFEEGLEKLISQVQLQ